MSQAGQCGAHFHAETLTPSRLTGLVLALGDASCPGTHAQGSEPSSPLLEPGTMARGTNAAAV